MTETSFDHYKKWLGIPPQDQPPHLYRLLGIEAFESDPEVIATAADGRMAQVRRFQTGKYSALSQSLLNEIAAAKVTLLNAEKKGAYDAELHKRLDAEKKPAPKAAPAARKTRSSGEVLISRDVPADSSTVAAYLATHRQSRRPWLLPALLIGGGLVVVAVLMVLISRAGKPPVAEVAPPPWPEQQPAATSPGTGQPPASANPGTQTAEGPQKAEAGAPQEPGMDVPPGAEPGNSLAGWPEEPPAAGGAQSGELVPAAPGMSPSGFGNRTLSQLLDPGDELLLAAAPPSPATPPADASGRLPVPDARARRDAEQKLREVFKREFDEARTAPQKRALAETLFAQGQETIKEPVARYVTVQLACELAAEGGDLALTQNAVAWLAQHYQVRTAAVRSYLFQKVLDSLGARPEELAACAEVMRAAEQSAREAASVDDYPTADGFARLALSAARKSRDAALVREMTVFGRDLERQQARYGAVRAALDVLAEKPDDPDANLTVGQWYCLVQGRWDEGLPMLARGTNVDLAAVARSELRRSQAAKDRMQLGDDWLALAEKERGPEKPAMEARAREHYAAALPGLDGLDKLRIEKQLEAMAAAEQPAAGTPTGAVVEGNVALAANGTAVAGVESNPNSLIDGNTGQGAPASGRWPCEWTITFVKPYRLKEIRLFLHEADNRFYNYAIATSADGRNFVPLVDRSAGQWRSLQEIQFEPRVVKVVKLIGLRSSVAERFYVNDFQAYCVSPPAQ